mmetsp:Transcript_27689/g.45971  ORF Transcript_27689/g.45971 Transcript_27689/m.45971 type:complete len:103 (+) Transcript_27689:2166-2474(+)
MTLEIRSSILVKEASTLKGNSGYNTIGTAILLGVYNVDSKILNSKPPLHIFPASATVSDGAELVLDLPKRPQESQSVRPSRHVPSSRLLQHRQRHLASGYGR